jgi:biotin carboxylase
MSSILVVGGSHSDLPLIESALLHGLTVHTTGNRPDHPGHRIGHGYVPGNYAQPQEIIEVARQLRVDFVVPGANDFAMIAAAAVAESLKLPGFDPLDTVHMLHLKDRFKAFACALDMPVCRHVVVRRGDERPLAEQLEGLRFPVMVKPVDLTGGKGISRVDDLDGIPAAIAEARSLSARDELVIEEWFDGNLHSYSTVIANGEIVFEYADTELCLFQPQLVSTSLSTCPVHPEALQAVRQATSNMVRALKLVDGVLHAQFLAREGEARVLEYTRRMSGDHYSRVVQMVRGCRHADVFIKAAMGQSVHPGLVVTQPTQPFVSRHCVTAQETGAFRGVTVSERIRPFVDSLVMAQPFGAPVQGDGRSKVAVAILSFPDEQAMRGFATSATQDLRCQVA